MADPAKPPEAPRDYESVFTVAKAGMESLSAQDKENIKKVGACFS